MVVVVAVVDMYCMDYTAYFSFILEKKDNYISFLTLAVDLLPVLPFLDLEIGDVIGYKRV